MLTRMAMLTVCAALLAVNAPEATFAQVGGGDPYHYRDGNPPGYHVNRMGYGNYRPGPNGSFGGYPAGSNGAKILQYQQEKKCLYAPESC